MLVKRISLVAQLSDCHDFASYMQMVELVSVQGLNLFKVYVVFFYKTLSNSASVNFVLSSEFGSSSRMRKCILDTYGNRTFHR